ncbi:MAG: hypothetical protein KC636_03045 [Myxococcales bacterium]|nr:hypothetical protein [Myxococcales bacterium]
MFIGNPVATIMRTLPITMPDFEATAVFGRDGEVIASSIPQLCQGRAGADLYAALVGTSEHVAAEIIRGALEIVVICGSQGSTVLARTESAVVMVLTPPTADLEALVQDLRRVARAVDRILSTPWTRWRHRLCHDVAAVP